MNEHERARALLEGQSFDRTERITDRVASYDGRGQHFEKVQAVTAAIQQISTTPPATSTAKGSS